MNTRDGTEYNINTKQQTNEREKDKMDEDAVKVVVGFVIIVAILGLFGWSCYNQNIRGNKKIVDTAFAYNYADVYLPGGEKKTIEIDKWADYEGEQIQIWAKDGNRYLISSFNTILREK